MANSPEPEDNQEEFTPEKNAKGVDNDDLFDDDNEPSIKLISTRQYSNVNKIANCDHLTDNNWHEWKERMK